MIDFARWDRAALAIAWREARPFPLIVIDDLIAPEELERLRAAIALEPHLPDRDELHDFLVSRHTLEQPELRALEAALGSEAALSTIGAITGKTLTRVELRSYVYLAQSYLLPHSDHRAGVGRQVAFAYYLTPDGGCVGGELELFACALEDGEIVGTQPERTIEQRANRLVLFDVSATSLHQVREVLAGARVSLAGWLS